MATNVSRQGSELDESSDGIPSDDGSEGDSFDSEADSLMGDDEESLLSDDEGGGSEEESDFTDDSDGSSDEF